MYPLLIWKAAKAGPLLSPPCYSAHLNSHPGTLQEAFLHVLTWGCPLTPAAWRWKACWLLKTMFPPFQSCLCQYKPVRSKKSPEVNCIHKSRFLMTMKPLQATTFSSVALKSQTPLAQPEHLQWKLLWDLDPQGAGREKAKAFLLISTWYSALPSCRL